MNPLFLQRVFYFCQMKNILIISALSTFSVLGAQFKISVNVPADYHIQEAILYTLNGSKDIVHSKAVKKGSGYAFDVKDNYRGLMKLYFPQNNEAVSFISENKDVRIQLTTEGSKIKEVLYLDPVNKLMDEVQEKQRQNESIFPALVQIKDYYKSNSEFGIALKKEIDRLGVPVIIDPAANPFISYYNTNYNKFLVKSAIQKEPTESDIAHFISNSNEMLESSSLLRPILMSYFNTASSGKIESSVDNLLNNVIVETPRGQLVLAELIELFGAYDMPDLKAKYLTKAKNLKCTIYDRLASTIRTNAAVEIGAVMPDYTFTSALNTTAKSIHGVKANRKVIVYWSSTCSHCEADLPKLLQKYNAMKAANVEVIGLSLDTDKAVYQQKAGAYPWINTTELRGWNSTFVDMYALHATPTYYVLDANNRIIGKPNMADDVLKFLNL